MLPLPTLPGVRHSWHDLPTGVRVHVAEAGPPDGPPVLALHGWPQHWYLWREVIPRLADELRLICPDLRGFGWSGQPPDGDFRKQRLADDQLALLDLLGIERAGLMGHDWGGWTGWLLGTRAPERIDALLVLNAVHPWQRPGRSLLNAWRLTYQWVLGAPVVGPALVRDGRLVRAAFEHVIDEKTARIFVEPLRQPEQAEATAALYRQFQLREIPALLRDGPGGDMLEMPVRVLFGRHDRAQRPAQLEGLDGHARDAQVELVDCGHFIVDERPALVADRARALFCG